jgi:anti-anti-sigma factor
MFIEIKQNEEVCFLRCEGRFVAGTDPEYLCAKRHEIKRLNCKKVLADFSEVSDLGSAGIGFIVGVYTFTRDSGGRFILVGLRPRVREVFDVTRVSTVIPLAADVSSGLAMLHGESPARSSGQTGNTPRNVDSGACPDRFAERSSERTEPRQAQGNSRHFQWLDLI